MKPRSLYGRIALVFAAILLGLGALLGWLGYTAAKHQQHEVLQRISLGLAGHIAEHGALMDATGLDSGRVDALFRSLMAVNPNIEVYLLDAEGRVLGHSPRSEPLGRERVALGPIRDLLAGRPLPIYGDNPRRPERREVFSAAPIRSGSEVTGYVYLVLLSDMYWTMVDDAWRSYVLRSAGWIAAITLLVALAAGLAAFAWITRRLDRLTREVEAFQNTALKDAPAPAERPPGAPAPPAGSDDEMDPLAAAFAQMRERLEHQMAELRRQDVLRRELVANVSHDLRTPLTSLQGYLETLVRMDSDLGREEQKQYLDVAVRQSRKVARLAQQLFELARLECEETLPQPELFSISELVQDIAQKFALAAQHKGVRLSTRADTEPQFVRGDIGMIERVISNLVDNAIRHTPQDGEIRLETCATAGGIEVRVADTGQGIAAEHLPGLLDRDSPLRILAARRGGGLGLLIANRMLLLHGSRISAASRAGRGTIVSFVLPPAEAM